MWFLPVLDFFKAHKYITILLAVIALGGLGYWQFNSWKNNLIKVSQKEGFKKAEKQYTEAITAANAKVAEKNTYLAAMEIAFDKLAQREQQDIRIKFDPIIKDIRNETIKDPIYRECVVSNGVRESINLGRATVNEAISSTTPSVSGQ